MPLVIVKLLPGKSEKQKARLSEEIVKDVMNVLNYGEESVSVAIEGSNHKIGRRRFINPTSRTSGRSSTRNRATTSRIYRKKIDLRSTPGNEQQHRR
jgi:Tautomerase enzyme